MCRATGFGTVLPNRYESVYSTRLRGQVLRTLVGDNLEAIAGQIVSQAATQEMSWQMKC